MANLTLRDCLPDFPDLPELAIGGVATDSRKVRPGDLFVALAGDTIDGHDFVTQAVADGAVAILAERAVSEPVAVPVAVAADARTRVGSIAAQITGDPSAKIGCIGITGTNGKTSVAYLVAQLLSGIGEPAGFGGTLGWGFQNQLCASELTTEDTITVQRRLAQARAAGARWMAMEVSSHALQQGRVAAVQFDIAVFTNLTRDHLDYHGDMDTYAAAKAKLFDFPSLLGGVINLDDDAGAALYARRKRGLALLGVGFEPSADVRISELQFDERGTRGVLDSPWGRHEVAVPLYGSFGFHNLAVALTAAALTGGDFDRLVEVARNVQSPPGRMQFVRGAGGETVVIDYAHTPDALEKALSAIRAHCDGPLVCVFGCGGDRDPGKRQLMAMAVERGADAAIVTNDNPRTENPDFIAASVCEGFSAAVAVEVELDRERAIRRALAMAGTGGVVLVAGKGHETYQEIAGRRLLYNDLDAARRVLEL